MDVISLRILGAGELWLDLEGVGTKVISLSLEQVGGEILGTVTVEPAESGAESWGWYSQKSCLGNNISPARLCLVDSGLEEVIEEQILEIWVFTIGRSDILEEDGSDDATTTPHKSNGWLVQLPLVLLGSLRAKLV